VSSIVQNLFDLSGKVALVTGGSRGLGLEIAEGLAEAGAKLFLLARRAQWLEPAVEQLRGRGFAVAGALCDVTNPDEVKASVASAVTAFGGLDVLVNNAGVSWSAPAEEMPIDKWRLVLQTNLDGAFFFSQEAAKVMIAAQTGGVIINVASIAGLKGVMPSGIHYAGYVASKGGLLALNRELAAKWAQYNIRVNAISPGFFPSRMTEKVIEEKGEAEMAKGIPMQRIGRPGELKGVALFLAAPASGYITGQNIVVDGGRTAV
jgi:NAD(P)-dependent dehydrogenase (short-subunit alcohol dehydrogenase family)